jgi:hypothetical protein
MQCPGSIKESTKAPPSFESEYAIRGTLQHEGVVRRWDGQSINSLKLTPEEVGNVDECLDYLRELVDGHEYKVDMEVRGDLKSIGYPDIWGTTDVVVNLPKELHIIDWKFGAGVPVLVDDNEQMLGYLLMIWDRTPKRMFMHLVQPPKNYFGVQEVSPYELETFRSNLEKAIRLSKHSDPPLNPGEKQCRFCPAAMTCRGRYKHQLEIAHEVFEHIKTKPSIVTPEESAKIYTKLGELVDYHKELGNYGFKRLSNGEDFPGYKLATGRSLRRWKDPAIVIEWLKKYTSIDTFYEKPKMLSPAKVEKLDRSLKKDSDFKQLIDKPPGKQKMVPDTDARSTTDVFNDL